MSEQPYMQLWIADYLGDTMHLTAEQHGAYLLLLMSMWRSGGRLPNDPVKLCRIARVQGSRWSKVWDSIGQFFHEEDGNLTQKRLQNELHEAREKVAQKRESGKLGGLAKSLKNKKRHLANGLANGKQNHTNQNQLATNVANEEAHAPVVILTEAVGEEKAKAIVEHRKALRKPLKAHSAKLLRNELIACGNAGDAADVMMLRGWLSIEPDWYDKARGRSPPQRHRNELAEAIDRAVEKAHRHDQGRDS